MIIKKAFVFGLLLNAGSIVLSPARHLITWGLSNPIKATVLSYVGTQTNLLGEVGSDISKLSSHLFSGSSAKYKKFSNELMVEFEKEFNKFNSKIYDKIFKGSLYGYSALVAVGKEEEADEGISGLLEHYKSEFLVFKNKFILNKKSSSASDPKEIKIIEKLDSILDGYPDVFNKNFMNLINKIKADSKKLNASEEDKKKLEDALSKKEEEPLSAARVEETPVPRIDPTALLLSGIIERKQRRREERMRRINELLSAPQIPEYNFDSKREDLRKAFDELIDSMSLKDQKEYREVIKSDPGLSKSNIFDHVERYVSTANISGSPEEKVRKAFCQIMRRSIDKNFLFVKYKKNLLFDFCEEYGFEDYKYNPNFSGRSERSKDYDYDEDLEEEPKDNFGRFKFEL